MREKTKRNKPKIKGKKSRSRFRTVFFEAKGGETWRKEKGLERPNLFGQGPGERRGCTRKDGKGEKMCLNDQREKLLAQRDCSAAKI